MQYFNPETSKKLEELGLESHFSSFAISDEGVKVGVIFSTLDICEIENAKKLWGEGERRQLHEGRVDTRSCVDPRIMFSVVSYNYVRQLAYYITLSDEERIKYVEDFLKSVENV